MAGIGSIPERQLPLQNYGKPTFVQPTAQRQLLGSIGKECFGGKVVESGPAGFDDSSVTADGRSHRLTTASIAHLDYPSPVRQLANMDIFLLAFSDPSAHQRCYA